MKKRAFTLIEIIITLTVLSIIITSTIISALRMDKIKEHKLEVATNSFNTSLGTALNEILFYDAQKGIKELSSAELMKYFAKYMDGELIVQSMFGSADNEESGSDDTTQNNENESTNDSSIGSCEEFVGGEYDGFAYLNSNVKCARFSPGIIAGFYVNSNCDSSFYVKEYKSEDLEPREVTNACGYVVYELNGSSGTFGDDLFVIGLGNRRLK